MKYLIYTILISSFVGFVSYATIETNKSIRKNTPVVSAVNTTSDIPDLPVQPQTSNIDSNTTIVNNEVIPIDNAPKTTPVKIRNENNEREDD